jgi:hypothetical protein
MHYILTMISISKIVVILDWCPPKLIFSTCFSVHRSIKFRRNQSDSFENTHASMRAWPHYSFVLFLFMQWTVDSNKEAVGIKRLLQGIMSFQDLSFGIWIIFTTSMVTFLVQEWVCHTQTLFFLSKWFICDTFVNTMTEEWCVEWVIYTECSRKGKAAVTYPPQTQHVNMAAMRMSGSWNCTGTT